MAIEKKKTSYLLLGSGGKAAGSRHRGAPQVGRHRRDEPTRLAADDGREHSGGKRESERTRKKRGKGVVLDQDERGKKK